MQLDFGGAVLLIVADIPVGRVTTYGDIAAALGSRGARAVGRVMAMEGSAVAWWRVVRADGRPPAGHEREALAHYREEGTPVRWIDEREAERDGAPFDEAQSYRLDLAAARWRP